VLAGNSIKARKEKKGHSSVTAQYGAHRSNKSIPSNEECSLVYLITSLLVRPLIATFMNNQTHNPNLSSDNTSDTPNTINPASNNMKTYADGKYIMRMHASISMEYSLTICT
jgi:hypothetical protein